jgi:hypothetical protein
VAAPAVVQPAPSTATTTTAAPTRATPTAPSVKNAKRDEARDLIDQVPSGLRKRFGF